jgi:hypothetical protein
MSKINLKSNDLQFLSSEKNLRSMVNNQMRGKFSQNHYLDKLGLSGLRDLYKNLNIEDLDFKKTQVGFSSSSHSSSQNSPIHSVNPV